MTKSAQSLPFQTISSSELKLLYQLLQTYIILDFREFNKKNK